MIETIVTLWVFFWLYLIFKGILYAVGFFVELIHTLIDPSHEMFSGDFWKFEWFKKHSGPSTSYDNGGDYTVSSRELREYKEELRSEKAASDYASYRSMGYSRDEADDRMLQDGYSRDERDTASYNYNKGCYIATASLQGNIPYDDLLPLKQWRYDVMEKSKFGNKLSNYYRSTAPELAKKVEQMPVLASFLRNWFIRPSLSMVTKKRTFFRNVLLYINFFFVLGLTTIFTKFKKF